jgi:hypothetical protein
MKSQRMKSQRMSNALDVEAWDIISRQSTSWHLDIVVDHLSKTACVGVEQAFMRPYWRGLSLSPSGLLP